jgi:mannose-6-phosphate isomerase-like protein (cupin superfamily)
MSTGPDVSRDQGRIREAQTAERFDQARTVLTSRDTLATTLMNALPSEGLAPEFHGELIPIDFGSTIDLDVRASAGTTGPHSHDTDGFHLILSGTVRVIVPSRELDVELGPGDWVWIPAYVEYTLEILVGPVRWCYRHKPPIPTRT